MDHLLSAVVCTPLIGFLVLLLIPSSQTRAIKLWTNIVFLVGLLMMIPLATGFRSDQDFQFAERVPWIPSIGASWSLAIDGYALLLILLTGLIGAIAVLASWS